MALPPASVPYRRDLHRGREISLYYDRQSPVEWPEHQHEQVQIMLLFEPAACVLKWRTQAGEQEQALIGSQICVIGPNQPHACRWEREADLLVIYVEPSLLRRVAKQDISGALLADAISGANHDIVIWELAWTLRHLCQEHAQLDEFVVDGIGGVLAMRLVKSLLESATNSSSPSVRLSRSRLRVVTDYIHAHLNHGIHVADLAKQVGLSVQHFTVVFKNTTGHSPYEYLTQCRMLRAHEMLLTGEYRQHEVAEAVGYDDPGRFSSKFRSYFGYSPKVLLMHLPPESDDLHRKSEERPETTAVVTGQSPRYGKTYSS